MKRPYFFVLVTLCLLSATQVAAQEMAHRPVLRWGMNFGGAWQSSDVRRIGGGGLGSTLEVPILENDRSLIGVSLRGRYLWSVTYGKDLKPTFEPAFSGGINYRNHRTSSTNWDLELLLKANRLRAKTGMLLYVWGGIGSMGSKARQNNMDELIGSGYYDYTGIGSGSIFSTRTQLNMLRDWTYETRTTSKWPTWKFAPSAGIGMGYEFTPWFSMAAEWKVSFPQYDMLDGYVGTNDNILNYHKDIHHYAGLHLDFGLFGGHATTQPPSNDGNFTPKGDDPAIVMVAPTGSHVDIQGGCTYEVRARMYNVRNKGLIKFAQGGVMVSPEMYTYDETTHDFSAMVTLSPGTNTFQIIARNQYGTASKTFTASCSQPEVVPTGNPPQVFVTFPTAFPAIIPDCRSVIHVTAYNVSSASDITVYHNGSLVPAQSYAFNPLNSELVMNVDLLPGDHRFEFIARNAFGQASTTAMLSCPKPQAQLPTVTITTPGITPFSSPSCMQTVVAAVTGVNGKNDISVYQDRVMLSPNAWAYSPSSNTVTLTVALNNGIQSMVEIVAVNQHGRASDLQMLQCYAQLPPPVIQIIRPTNGFYQGTNCNQFITARILNISGIQDIRVLDGSRAISPQSYSFNPYSQIFSMDAPLTPGIREQFTLIATNGIGQDRATVQLQCTQPVEPMITICHIPPSNPANVLTLTIPASQWPGHQAHGDMQGPCSPRTVVVCFQGSQMTISQSALPAYLSMGATQGPCQEPMITICHIPPSNLAAAATMTVPRSAFPSHQAHGDLQGPCSDQTVSICYNGQNLTVSQTVWKVYQNMGATQGPCPVRTVTICHIPPGNPAAVQTITIPEASLPSHQAHGDIQGPCSNVMVEVCYQSQTMTVSQSAWKVFQSLGATRGACPPRQITICHIPPDDPTHPQTTTIPETDWPGHQAHGDIQGACSSQQVTLCYNQQTVTVSATAAAVLMNMGALQGACPPRQITICHIPPENPANATTITLPESQWASHQSHGDVQGPCDSKATTICYQNQTLVISQSAWSHFQTLGATRGPCPVRQIAICHIPPSNPDQLQTIMIPMTAWPEHQAHGDTEGACNTTPMTVCHHEGGSSTGVTTTIATSAWRAHQAHGDVQGSCPVQTITICHLPPGNPDGAQTVTIPMTEWPSHQSHGDTQGTCDLTTVTICHHTPGQTQTIQIPRASLPAHLAHGDTEGECPVQEISICHIPPGNPGNPQTITIPVTAWSDHQAHGDVQGSCNMTLMPICHENQTIQIPTASWTAYQALGAAQGPCVDPEQIVICHFTRWNPLNPQTISIPESAWVSHRVHGDTRGACNMTLITICNNGKTEQIPAASWTLYEHSSATQGACPELQVTICHIPPGNPGNPQTITIPQNAWPEHQSHGDSEGSCNMTMITICTDGRTLQIPTASWPFYQAQGATQDPCPEADITICHIPPGNPANPQTITVSPNAWPAHQAHGDTQGACNMTMMTICSQGSSIQVPTASWPAYQAQGAAQGACAEPDITICHIPPGNPANPQTITVSPNAWPAHQAHGDTQGACNMTMMTICSNGSSIQVPAASWPAYQAQGAAQGACAEPDITICHIPPGNPANPQTITVSPNAWPAHQAHGDTQGACNMTMMTICYNGQTMKIPTASWPYYRGQGATEGECPKQNPSNGGGNQNPPPKNGGAEKLGQPTDGGSGKVKGSAQGGTAPPSKGSEGRPVTPTKAVTKPGTSNGDAEKTSAPTGGSNTGQAPSSPPGRTVQPTGK